MLFDNHGRPKQRLPIWIPALVCVLTLALAAVIVANRPRPEPTEPDAPVIPEISVVEVRNAQARPLVATTGRVSSPHEINLVSRVSGIIESVAEIFRDGASFSDGDLLMKIEDHDYLVAQSQSEANLASALQQLATEQGLSDQAQREWRDLGNAEANSLFLREPQLNSAKAQVEAARSSLEQAGLNLERTEIRAPFIGVISSRNADVGQFISAGTVIAQVHSTEAIQVKVSLTPNEIFDLGWQNRASVELDQMSVEVIYRTGSASVVQQAELRHISPLIDPMTQMTEVTIDLSPEAVSSTPSPGQFVEVELSSAPIENAVWLPQSALYERDQILLANDNQLRIQRINVVASANSQILVSGLEDGDLAVVDRPLWVIPGQSVAPIPLEN